MASSKYVSVILNRILFNSAQNIIRNRFNLFLQRNNSKKIKKKSRIKEALNADIIFCIYSYKHEMKVMKVTMFLFFTKLILRVLDVTTIFFLVKGRGGYFPQNLKIVNVWFFCNFLYIPSENSRSVGFNAVFMGCIVYIALFIQCFAEVL